MDRSQFLINVIFKEHILAVMFVRSEQYMMRGRKRTEEEERLLKLLQGMKSQDGFTTWCEQMLHALNTSANNSSSQDGMECGYFSLSVETSAFCL